MIEEKHKTDEELSTNKSKISDLYQKINEYELNIKKLRTKYESYKVEKCENLIIDKNKEIEKLNELILKKLSDEKNVDKDLFKTKMDQIVLKEKIAHTTNESLKQIKEKDDKIYQLNKENQMIKRISDL